jgi:hypothetical protein
MTPFQRSVVDAIKTRMSQKVPSATEAEIAAELGGTEAEVHEALATLMHEGVQRWREFMAERQREAEEIDSP